MCYLDNKVCSYELSGYDGCEGAWNRMIINLFLLHAKLETTKQTNFI